MNEIFHRFAQYVAKISGSAKAFLAAVSLILIWLITGPFFEYSNHWQLAVNTGTTIITFLMVFIIQNTQNRDSKAMHLKIDELIRAVKGARLSLMDAEELPDEKLDIIQREFKNINQNHNVADKNIKYYKNLEQKEPMF